MSAVPLAIKTEEVILENAEYNSAEELDEELQLQLEDSGGENTYHIEYTTDPAHHHQVTTNSQRRQSNMSGGGTSNTTKGGGAGGGGGGGGGSGSGAVSDGDGKPMADSEKRMRREIANSNERRRMQSINAGFQSLRSLLPRHEGEKLSKAAILQQTFQYIVELENQKTQLLTQNSELKRQVGEHEAGGGNGNNNSSDPNYNNEGGNAANGGGSSSVVAIKKRKLTDNVINIQTISDSSDEGLGSMSPEPMTLLSGQTAAAAAAATKLNNASIIAAKELLEMKKQLEKERSLRRLLEDELQMIKRQLYSVATAPPGTAGTVAVAGGSTSHHHIPREVIEHTDNFVRSDELEELAGPGTVSYVEIDEMTGQQQVVVCSSIEELEAEDATGEIIAEDHHSVLSHHHHHQHQVHEEVILSSNSSTESENEVNVNAIAKAYAEGSTPNVAMLQPILQAAIKATPKVEVERINEKLVKVKAEKLDHQPAVVGFTRSRQNLETIVEAIRHLEGDHLFSDGGAGGEKQYQGQQLHHQTQQQQQQQPQHHLQQQHHVVTTSHHLAAARHRLAQDAPLALTTSSSTTTTTPSGIIAGVNVGAGTIVKQQHHAALAELRPFLQLKGNKQVIITAKSAKSDGIAVGGPVTPTAIFKVQTASTSAATSSSSSGNNNGSSSNQQQQAQQLTITTALKQCRPGVIVAKQLNSS
ncbi:box A-binding factor [Drosophila tropicalis]|uniref:box A-binding factor n=1 Tax=Drosophila tropicalis TaxID=46794 RepID=UPI0035ABD1C5